MGDEPTVFLTVEALNTIAGQTMVVGMVTQAVKSFVPTLTIYRIRAVAIVSGIAIHSGLVWKAGMDMDAYILALVNGILVAMSAMKMAEMIKGDK